MAGLQYDFLNDSFTTYENVEPTVTESKISLPLGDVDLPEGLYLGNNGIIQPTNQITQEKTPIANVYNTQEHRSTSDITSQEEAEVVSNELPVNYSSNPNNSGNKKTAYDFFISKGLKPHHAAGIVGNLFGESGLNYKAVNPKSKAYGLAQWLGNRKKKLFAKYGNNPTFEQQLDFLWEELNGDEKSAFSKLLQTNSVEAATGSFMRHFERPSDKEMAQSISKRVKYAKTLLS